METVSQNKLWASNETRPKQYLNGGQQKDAVDRFSNHLPLPIESY